MYVQQGDPAYELSFLYANYSHKLGQWFRSWIQMIETTNWVVIKSNKNLIEYNRKPYKHHDAYQYIRNIDRIKQFELFLVLLLNLSKT